MIVLVNSDNEWLCYDGLFKEYYFREAFDMRAITFDRISKNELEDIKSKVGEIVAMKVITKPLQDFDFC